MKKYMNRPVILLWLIAGMFSACNKFLDITPKSVIIPEKVADYEGLLNSPTLTKPFPINLLDFTDDNLNALDALTQSPTANGYYWRPIITINEKASPEVWGPLYHCIYDANVVINGIGGAAEGTAVQKQQILGEALVMRAGCYLDLLTVFAKAYNASTAASDPGLPLVTSINVTDAAPQRASLKATLDTLVSNVTAAAAMLPTDNINRYRVTKYAAYGLLSRIYLYMADYVNAKKYTDLALQATHALLNYNAYADYTQMPVYDLNPEVLWQRAAVSGSPVFMLYSANLKTYFNADDLRYIFLTVTNNNGLGRASLPGRYNFGITFPEMYLTKAELLARAGDFTGAMTVVNLLRKNRIKTAVYADQSATSPEDALVKVLAERRRELAYSGLRWFDMKRLDQEGRMPEITRVDPTTGAVLAKLSPHGDNYTFEIPVRVSQFNPSMTLNHK
jgi:hypothetical protein